MIITHAEIFARLADWIPDDQVRFREGQNGGHYVKAPTVMNRLDDVVGPADWWDDYRIIDDLTVECSLSIRLPDGQVITKRDVGLRKPAKDGRIDPGCSWKAAYSDALKRAAVKFGVARHLCKCGFPAFVGAALGEAEAEAGAEVEPATDRRLAELAPAPKAHERAHHEAHEPDPPPPRKERGQWGNGNGQTSGTDGPRSGRALFAWLKEQDQLHKVGLLTHINWWARLQDFPGRIVDFDKDQIKLAHAEALRKLASVAGRGDAFEEAIAN
jgi:hypothetical protein